MTKKKGGIAIRKAVNLGIAFVALIILLGSLIGIFPSVGESFRWIKDQAKDLTTKEEFVPYKDQFTDDDQTVDDSMKALMCGTQSSTREKLDVDYCISLGGIKKNKGDKTTGMATAIDAEKQIECDGILFGEKCVECEGQHSIEIETSLDVDIDRIAEEIIDCYDQHHNKNENIRCAEIKTGKRFRGIIRKSEIEKKLKEKRGIQWNLPNQMITSKTGSICIAWEGEGWDNLYVGICSPKFPKKEFSCGVKGFELPQDLSGITADDFITGANDPRWLAYYESFPKGEETAWQISKSSFWIDVVFFGAVLNAIPVAGPIAGRGVKKGVGLVTKKFAKEGVEKFAKEGVEKVTREGFEKTLRETGQAMGKELSEKAISEFGEIFYEEGYRRLLKSQFLYDELLKKGIAPELAEDIRAKVFKRWTWYAKRGGKAKGYLFDIDALGRLTTDIDTTLLKNADDVTKKLVKEQIEIISRKPLSESLEKSLQSKQAIKQFFARNLLDESGEKLSKEALEELFTKKVSKEVFEKLPNEAQERLLERALSYSDEMWSEGLVDINLKNILGTTDEGIINGIKGQFTDFFGKSYGTLMTDDWITSVKKLAIGDKSFKFPLQGRIGRKKIRFTGKYRPAVIRTIFKSAGASGLAVGTDAYNIFVRSRLGRYTTAIVIGNWLAQGDAQNEKFKGKGINTFVVSSPYDYGSSPRYEPPNIGNYYVQLAKEKGDSSRFFLASPCKTDLAVSKTITRCEITKGNYILKETQQPVNAGSIKFDESAVEIIAVFDKMSPEDKIVLMERCLNENLVFKDCFSSFLKKHEDSFDILIDEIFKLVDRPIMRFMKKYNIKSIPEDFSDLVNIYGVNTRDQDYPIFGRFHSAANHYSVLRTFTNEYRQNKISKEEFKEKLKQNIVRDFYTNEKLGESQEQVKNMMNSFYQIRKESPLYFSNVFNTNNGVFFTALKDYALYYRTLDNSKIDKSKAEKICNKPQELEKGTEGILIRDVAELKGWSTVDSITIVPHMDEYNGNWNNGVNYCFSGSHTGITALKWLANGIAVAIDIGVGMTGVGLLVEAPVALVTGAGAAAISKVLSKYEKWPYH